MSFSTKLFPHSLIGVVSVLPALLVMPAMAYVLPTDGSTITGDLDEMQVVLSGRKVAFENVSASGVVEPQYSGAVIENLGNATMSGNNLFTLNSAPAGGVLYNTGTMNLNGVFGGIDDTDPEHPLSLGNSASNGGAIYNANTGRMEVGGTFTSNNASSWGGAIYNAGNLTVADNTAFNYNKAGSVGGAITNALGTSVLTLGSGVTFTGNEAGNDGGAIGNYKGATLVNGTTFTANKAQTGTTDVDAIGGGAMSLGAESTTQIANATFDSNTSGFNGGAIGTRNALSASNVAAALDITDSIFTGNKALGTVTSTFKDGTITLTGGNGGALDNHFYNSASKDGYAYVSGSTFTNNEALNGGAIYNNGTADSAGNIAKLYLSDSTFGNNAASDKGGAIYNKGTLSLVAENDDVSFFGNTANGSNNDIYNVGTLNLNASSNRLISFAGGIDGASGTMDITGEGLVDVSNTLNGQTVTVHQGQLHLSDAMTLNDTTINVLEHAAINTQDNAINDYSSKITLQNNAGVLADANASSMDKFGIASGNTVTLSGLKMLADLETTSEDRNLATAGDVTIDPALKVYTTANKYAVTGNTSDNGKITIAKDGIGGLSAAVTSTDAGAQETVNYAITGAVDDATVTADVEIKKAAFTLVGAGTEAGDTGVTLDKKLAVDGTSSLSVENAKIAGEGSIDNANELSVSASNVDVDVNNAGNTTFTDTTFATGNTFTNAVGATTTLLDSVINGTFRNFGIVHSDPTTIAGLYDNVGYTDFDNDTFDTTAELRNTGTVDLKNSVTFESGATITGDGVMNMLSGTTHFNNTASSNTLKLASGAKFDGTLASTGVLDTRNANIDTGLGTVTGGDLFVDANLVAGSVDSFADTTGATIKGIKLANAGYGTSNKVELDFGAASLDANVEVEGTNYFTKVEKDGDNIVFSDKLINESNLDAKLGSWTGGNYIGANSDMTHDANGTTYQNVGQALKNLDTNVKANADAIATLNGDSETAGSVDYKIANATINQSQVSGLDTTLAGKQDKLTDAQLAAANSGITADKVSTYDGYATTISSNSTAIATLNGDAETAGSVDYKIANATIAQSQVSGLGTALTGKQDKLSDAQLAAANSGITADKVSTYDGYATTISSNSTAIATLNGDAETAGSVDYKIANATIAQSQVSGLDTALAGKQATLTDAQLAAANSGITADKVSAYDGYATTISSNTSAIATLNGNAETEGSVEYKIASALSTSGSGGAISNAIDEKITAAVADNGTVTNAIAGATTMGATAGNNYAADTTVVQAIETIDTNIGKVHGLIGHVGDNDANPLEFHGSGTTASTNVVSGEYKGNLAVGTTIEDHLVSLDNTIGTMSALDMTNGVLDNTMSVAQNLQNLDTAIANVRTSALADANAYTDHRIESLDKNLSAGVAGAVALSSVAVSGVERGEVSVGAGYGYFNGQSAAAFGAAVGLSNRWSVNAGAGISNADVSFRAGTNYKFKLF